jgi:hypothetical protein
MSMTSDPAYGGGQTGAAGSAFAGTTNPVAGFQQDISNFNSSPNNLQNILGQLEGSTAPQQSISELQAALAGNQYNINTQQYQLSNTNLEQQAANQEAQLGISGQQLGIQGQGLQAQAGLLGTTTGLEQQEYGLQQQQYPEQLAEAALNFGANQQSLTGNLAASGATNTVGANTQQNLLSQNYGYQQADINRAQQESALQQQGTTAQQQYSAGDLARQQQNLALVATSNGLSQQEVAQQLGYGLAQSGLDYEQNLPQLLNSLSSIYEGQLGTAEGAAGELGLLGGTSLSPSQVSGVGSTSGLNLISPGVSSLG